MKLIQITFFSLLMGIAVAAHATSDFDKDYAECSALEDAFFDANNEREQVCEELHAISRSDEDAYETARKICSKAMDKYSALNRKRHNSDCRSVFEKKAAMDKGLSPQ